MWNQFKIVLNATVCISAELIAHGILNISTSIQQKNQLSDFHQTIYLDIDKKLNFSHD